MFSSRSSKRTGSRGTWDRHGDVRSSNDESSQDRPRTRGFTFTSSSRRTTQTMQWPFMSSSTRPESQSTVHLSNSFPSFPSFQRRGTFAGLGRPVSSIMSLDSLIPDYVVNFIRGETPETLARKRGRQGPLNPGFRHHTRQHQSRTAEFHCSGEELDQDQSRSPSAVNDLEHMMGDGEKGMTGRRQRRLMAGWRGGVALYVLLVFLILAAAIVCLILISLKARKLGGETSIVSITGDDDSKVLNVSRGLHVVVNVFGVVLLAGANYVYQILLSPTRAEVDAAHEKLQWLDIGIPSLRNLAYVTVGRVLLSCFLLIVALGTQILYNALIFTTHTVANMDDDIDAASPSSVTLQGTLLGAIAILNLLLVFGLLFALCRPAFDPLVTLGDALASFLTEPDPTTQGACIMTRDDVQKGRWGLREPKTWTTNSTHRWLQTPSLMRWLGWCLSWITPVALTAAALAVTLKNDNTDSTTTESLKVFGNPTTVYRFPVDTPHPGLAILASLPHVVLGVLYLSTNALYTVFYLSHELSQFAVPNHLFPLRVSSGQPEGAQMTSLYLTLPRPVSWLLFFLFVAMGFVLSQGLFLTTFENPDGTSISVLGLSPLPLTILLALLVVLGIMTLGMSLRRADPSATVDNGQSAGNPLVLRGGTCSAVLSARCHRIPQESEVATQPVNWGVVYEGAGMHAGHATFSSRVVELMKVGKTYS